MTSDSVDAAGALDRARALIQVRRYGDAVAIARQAVGVDPSDARPWCVLAEAQIGMGDNPGALVSARQAIALSPDSATAYQLASVALNGTGQDGEAVYTARQAVRLTPDSWSALTRLARALVPVAHHPRELSEARELAIRAREMAPMEPHSHLTVGAIEAAGDNREGAVAAYRRVLELDPDNHVAHNEIARLQLLENPRGFAPRSLATAVNHFATAVQSAPDSAVSRRNIDVVVGIFLARSAYLIFLSAWATFFLSGSSSTVARVIPILILVIPGVFASRFVTRLTPSLRVFIRRALLYPRHRLVAAAAEVAAIALVVAAALIWSKDRPGLAVIAVAAAVLARVALYIGRKAVRRA
jgi:Flp pilus assembly protein TadD